MVIFDLRHNFYTIRELWQYLLDTVNNPGQSKIDAYHFFQFWPLVFLGLGYLTYRLNSRSKWLAFIFCALYLALNLSLPLVDFNKAVGMPDNLTFALIDTAAKRIGFEKNLQNFNVTSLPDADFRAYALRYLVTYRYHKTPRPAENYADIDYLYAIAGNDFFPTPNSPWEVTALGAKRIEKLTSLGDSYALFKLTR